MSRRLNIKFKKLKIKAEKDSVSHLGVKREALHEKAAYVSTKIEKHNPSSSIPSPIPISIFIQKYPM